MTPINEATPTQVKVARDRAERWRRMGLGVKQTRFVVVRSEPEPIAKAEPEPPPKPAHPEPPPDPEPPPLVIHLRDRISLGWIKVLVASAFGVTHYDLISHSREGVLPLARQVSMYLGREILKKSYPQIAYAHGGRDHTTALHGVTRVRTKMLEDADFAALVERLRERVLEAMA
jgi:hypothetical protein